MMTESVDVPPAESSAAVPTIQNHEAPTVATLEPSAPQTRRHSDPILPPPPPNSPYAFPPTYEEAMASKALEEGDITPEIRAYLERRGTDLPGRTRRIAPEDRATEPPRERLSSRFFVRKRVFIFRACLYTFILVLVIAAIVISVMKADSHMGGSNSPTTTSSPRPSSGRYDQRRIF